MPRSQILNMSPALAESRAQDAIDKFLKGASLTDISAYHCVRRSALEQLLRTVLAQALRTANAAAVDAPAADEAQSQPDSQIPT